MKIAGFGSSFIVWNAKAIMIFFSLALVIAFDVITKLGFSCSGGLSICI